MSQQQITITFSGCTTLHTLPPDPHQTPSSFALHHTQSLTGIPQHFLHATLPSPQTPNPPPNPIPVFITLRPCLLGGKGGFGAALRASGKSGGAQTTDFGACRDLNGRRLRHVNNEIRLRIWREKQEQVRRAKARGEKVDPLALGDADKNTASGIEGWHLSVPQWAEGLGKVKRQRLHRKTRLCVNWVRAREQGAPKGAPRWWGCPRGRSCDFAHGEEELDETAREKLLESRKKERRIERNAEVMKHTRDMMEREGAMQGAVLKGLQRAKVAAQEKRLQRVREVGETLGLKEEGGKRWKNVDDGDAEGLPVDGLAGEMGVGATGEVEGRSEFATAGSPLAAVREGRWYYEVEVLSAGIVQVGFGSDEFVPDQVNGDGVGDCPASWSYDGSRSVVFDQGNERPLAPQASKWTQGDVVGCVLDLDAHQPTCSFTLNGKSVASLELARDSPSTPGLYYPAVSLNSGQAVRLNYGQMPFRCFNPATNATPFTQALRSPDQPPKTSAELPQAKPAPVAKLAVPTSEPGQEKSTGGATKKKEVAAAPSELREIDLDSCDTAVALGEYSLEELKVALQKRGLKCGGTLEERRKRLFSIKGLKPHEIDASLIAGAKSKRKKSRAKKQKTADIQS